MECSFQKSDTSGFFLPWKINQDHGRTDLGLFPGLHSQGLAPGSSMAFMAVIGRESGVTRDEGQSLLCASITASQGHRGTH